MKSPRHSQRASRPAELFRGLGRRSDENKKKAMELGAQAEHETGSRRERLIREARRKAS